MTKRNPDSVSLNVIGLFLLFAEHGNAEQAGAKSDPASTTVQRGIARLEAWLHRVLITPDNPGKLTPEGENFLVVAKEIRQLAISDGIWNERKKTRVSQEGLLTIGGVEFKSKTARAIGKWMLDARDMVISSNRRAGDEADQLYVYTTPAGTLPSKQLASRSCSILEVIALKIRSNIRLLERLPLDENGLDVLQKHRFQLAFITQLIESYREVFGPFERPSGAQIKMD